MRYVSDCTIETVDMYGQDGSFIRKAATTCYRSEDKTDKTANDFIRMVKGRLDPISYHASVLEFMWVPLLIEVGMIRNVESDKIARILDSYLTVNQFTVATTLPGTTLNGKTYILVSANARAWFEWGMMMAGLTIEYLPINRSMCDRNSMVRPIIDKILETLVFFNPVLFGEMGVNFVNTTESNASIRIIRDSDELFSILTTGSAMSPEGEEWLFEAVDYKEAISIFTSHDWFAVKISGISRNFTHQIVRHRALSFSQMSTRYVDFSKPENSLDMVIPDMVKEGKTSEQISKIESAFNAMISTIETWYNELLSLGTTREVARGILPSNMSNEICLGGRVSDWIFVGHRRINDKASPETRTITDNVICKIKNTRRYLYEQEE